MTDSAKTVPEDLEILNAQILAREEAGVSDLTIDTCFGRNLIDRIATLTHQLREMTEIRDRLRDALKACPWPPYLYNRHENYECMSCHKADFTTTGVRHADGCPVAALESLRGEG